MEKKISFIHAADLHLDSPFKGISITNETVFQDIRQSTFAALDNLVAAAIKKKVDFILLVGDLFDNDKQSLKAQIKLRNAFQELEKHDIAVYLSYGNHDYVKGNIYPINYPQNVHSFSSEQVESFVFQKENENLAAIYGFSYENRAVVERKVQEYDKTDSSIPFHIAMLHGSVESNTEHDTYAPFQLSELIEKDFDYWALGHIHKREVIKEKPYVIYPGNIQGRNRKETGEKGCYFVEMDELQTVIEFLPLHAIQFNKMTVDVTNCERIHDLEGLIKANLTTVHSQVPMLIDFTLRSDSDNLLAWKNEYLLEEIIEIVNESLTYQNNWNYIFRFTTEITHQENGFQGEHFISEVSSKMADLHISSYIQDLFQHKEARKYLQALTPDEEEEVKQEAYELLIHELQKE